MKCKIIGIFSPNVFHYLQREGDSPASTTAIVLRANYLKVITFDLFNVDVDHVILKGFVQMLFALPMIPPARMVEYLQLLEAEIEHFEMQSAQEFGHKVLTYIRCEQCRHLMSYSHVFSQQII